MRSCFVPYTTPKYERTASRRPGRHLRRDATRYGRSGTGCDGSGHRGAIGQTYTRGIARASATNAALAPPAAFCREVGQLVVLTARTLAAAVRPPYPYGDELIDQFLFALRLC